MNRRIVKPLNRDESGLWPVRFNGSTIQRLILTLLLLISPALTISAQTTSTETGLKAVYLFHFAQFVEWPQNAFADTNSPFVICVFGDDALSGNLEDVAAGEKVRGRNLIVRRCTSLDDIAGSQILFISRSQSANIDRVLARVKGKSVLTVSDYEGFTSRGGMIRFFTERNKVHFRINTEEPPKAGLTISSKLLRLADRVGGKS